MAKVLSQKGLLISIIESPFSSSCLQKSFREDNGNEEDFGRRILRAAGVMASVLGVEGNLVEEMVNGSYGGDGLRIDDETAECLAHSVNEFIDGVSDPTIEETFFHTTPDTFDWIEVWRIWWQIERLNMVPAKSLYFVPTCIVDDEHNLLFRFFRVLSELVKKDLEHKLVRVRDRERKEVSPTWCYCPDRVIA